MERTRSLVWPANVYVLFAAALVRSGRPWQSTAPVGGVSQLPSAYHVVHGPTGIPKERFAFSEWQLVNRSDYKYVVTHKVIWAVSDGVTDCIIVVVVWIGVSERVVRNELQSLTEALIHFRFKRIVVSARVIAIVVAQIVRKSRTAGCGQVA